MTTRDDFSRFTLDLPKDLRRRLRRYAVENDMFAADVCRGLLLDFLDSQEGGEKAVEGAMFRRGFEAGARAERERIAEAVQSAPARSGLPTSPPRPVELPQPTPRETM